MNQPEAKTGKGSLKRRLYIENAKVRRTSHWDLDYMPLKELERLYAETASPEDRSNEKQRPVFGLSQRKAGIACIALGVLLVVAALAFARVISV